MVPLLVLLIIASTAASNKPIRPHLLLHNLADIIDDDRIVGGVNVKADEFPHQVSLQLVTTTTWFFCGGSLISDTAVLTAAHCCALVLTGPDQIPGAKIAVKTGTIHLNKGGKVYDVEEVIAHESFDRDTLANDICILKLKNRIQWNSATKAIKLNRQTSVANGISFVVTGWGATTEGGDISNDLKKVSVPFVNTKVCSADYPGQIKDTMICAGTGGRDSCQGDSGGPLVYKDALYGIVSWGTGCARPKFPGVYTDVADFYTWISSKVDLAS